MKMRNGKCLEWMDGWLPGRGNRISRWPNGRANLWPLLVMKGIDLRTKMVNYYGWKEMQIAHIFE